MSSKEEYYRKQISKYRAKVEDYSERLEKVSFVRRHRSGQYTKRQMEMDYERQSGYD